MSEHRRALPLLALLLLAAVSGLADDERAQYPPVLAKGFIGVDLGYIEYPFTGFQLQPGNQVESVGTPHLAVRVALLGYRFNSHLAAQLTYMRPVEWVKYRNVDGVQSEQSVWMNVGGFTLRGTLPVQGPLSLRLEAGLGIVTRSGFQLGGVPVVTDASYATVLLGGGLKYRLNDGWDLGLNATYVPSHHSVQQPHTLMVSGGFTFNMTPLSEETVRATQEAGYVFPRDRLQVGYTTDALGFGVNRSVTHKPLVIFWGGRAQVHRGLSVDYQRNVFHGLKVFALDVGATVATWRSEKEGQSFNTFSLYPRFEFTPMRVKPADVYLFYSLAGPTVISRVRIDGLQTGRHFTFQDLMGLGANFGPGRRANAEVRIGHYSNGNLFGRNAGVSIPLTFRVGFSL